MTGRGVNTIYLPQWFPLAAATFSMICFVALHWKSKKGKKTVVPSTYVNGSPQMYKREDVFVNKIVTRRHIPKSSGGRGGGSRGSGGGGSSHSHGGHHGGGGRSR